MSLGSSTITESMKSPVLSKDTLRTGDLFETASEVLCMAMGRVQPSGNIEARQVDPLREPRDVIIPFGATIYAARACLKSHHATAIKDLRRELGT